MRLAADEMEKGVLSPITVSIILAGADTTKYTLVNGGKHPKMRLICDTDESKSRHTNIVYDTSDGVVEVIHEDGRTAALAAGATNAIGTEAFVVDVADGNKVNNDIFEADEDVIVYCTTGSNAAGVEQVYLYFEVLQ